MLSAELLMTIGGAVAFLLTINWVRSRDLREKYAVVWICVAFALLIIGLFPGLVMYFASEAHLAYPSAVLFVALAAIYVSTFSMSVSISRQYRRNARLMQEFAIMEMRLRELERQSAAPKPTAPPHITERDQNGKHDAAVTASS
jgi:hypothetical protein